MRKRLPIRDTFPDKAMDFAHRLGDGLRQAPDGAGRWLQDVSGEAGRLLRGGPQGAGKWLQAGVALGAARTGVRAAGMVARRHPVALTAAAIGIGAALYAVARHRRKQAEQEAFEGRRAQRMRDAIGSEDIESADAVHADPVGGDLGVGAER